MPTLSEQWQLAEHATLSEHAKCAATSIDIGLSKKSQINQKHISQNSMNYKKAFEYSNCCLNTKANQPKHVQPCVLKNARHFNILNCCPQANKTVFVSQKIVTLSLKKRN